MPTPNAPTTIILQARDFVGMFGWTEERAVHEATVAYFTEYDYDPEALRSYAATLLAKWDEGRLMHAGA